MKKSLKKKLIENSDEVDLVLDDHKPVEVNKGPEQLAASSLYTRPPVQLQFGEGETTFYVPAHLAQSFTWQGRLPDVDTCSGHALVHWLYHKEYSTLGAENPDIHLSDVAALEKALRIYIMARFYNLEGLDVLAQGKVEKHGANIEMLHVLEMSRNYFPKLEADTWYRAYLAGLVTKAFDQDHTVFRSETFLEVLGTAALHKFLTNFVLTLFSQKLEEADEQNLAPAISDVDEAMASASDVMSNAGQLCELDYPSVDGATTDLTEDAVMVEESSSPQCVVEPAQEDDPWSFACKATREKEKDTSVEDELSAPQEIESVAELSHEPEPVVEPDTEPVTEPAQAVEDVRWGSLWGCDKKKKKKKRLMEKAPPAPQEIELTFEPAIQLTSVLEPSSGFECIQEPGVIIQDDPWEFSRTSIKEKKKNGNLIEDAPPPPPEPEPEPESIVEAGLESVPDCESEPLAVSEPVTEEAPSEPPIPSIRRAKKKVKKSRHVEEAPWAPPEPEEVCETVPEPEPEPAVEREAEPFVEAEPEPVPEVDHVQAVTPWRSFSSSYPKKSKKTKKTKNTKKDKFIEELAPPPVDAEPVPVSESPLQRSNALNLDWSRPRASGPSQYDAQLASNEIESASPHPTIVSDPFVCPYRIQHMFESSEWKECFTCRSVVSNFAMELQ